MRIRKPVQCETLRSQARETGLPSHMERKRTMNQLHEDDTTIFSRCQLYNPISCVRKNILENFGVCAEKWKLFPIYYAEAQTAPAP